MKFLVNQMPDCSWECPFFDDTSNDRCKLDGDICDCMSDKIAYWGADDCRWLEVVNK